MPVPVAITFRGLDHSDSVEAAVQRWVSRLEHISSRIMKCEVMISKPHRRHRHGDAFAVGVIVEIPGGDIATTNVGHVDVYVAVADAFRATRRQLGACSDQRHDQTRVM